MAVKHGDARQLVLITSYFDDVILCIPYVWNKVPYEVYSIFHIPYGPVWSMEYG